MERIGNIFQQRIALEKTTAALVKSERDELIRKFDNRGICVKDRKTKEYRPATLAELAILLRHCPTKDLYPFLRECEKANHFAKFFYWALKGRKKRD